MTLVEENYGKTQVNGQERQTDSGNKGRQTVETKADRQWKQRQTVETKAERLDTKAQKQWKHSTAEGREAKGDRGRGRGTYS